MNRLHVHLNVKDLDANVRFYSALFGAEPVRIEQDYAKWLLDDPAVNFAISTRAGTEGLDHLGFQVDAPEQLSELKQRAQKADLAMLDEGETTCCYARSDKHWIQDPQGLPWEHFLTLDQIPTFNDREVAGDAAAQPACCASAPAPSPAAAGCCAKPATPSSAKSSCC
ncbi:ArsI/CadI family heavy metal resistance metalloenzyme [Hydrogenophaga sp. 5NK40-0174]|uniref:ArsI/CadI family heavy metal resistance metalloenzyme n=1 Tax=Hydrogenophaga sp. 5NK40-0174 TaxID=3127649 RepID=UPI0031093522